jgi:hypothetical protein
MRFVQLGSKIRHGNNPPLALGHEYKAEPGEKGIEYGKNADWEFPGNRKP